MKGKHRGHGQPYRALASAVLWRAYLDSRRVSDDESDRAFVWLATDPLAKFLCDGAGIEHGALVQKAIEARR